MTVSWFLFRRETHAFDVSKKRLTTACGLIPMADFAPEIQTLTEGTWPEGVCRRCLTIVGSTQTNDEPIGFAKDRGYVASADVKGLAPLPAE